MRFSSLLGRGLRILIATVSRRWRRSARKTIAMPPSPIRDTRRYFLSMIAPSWTSLISPLYRILNHEEDEEHEVLINLCGLRALRLLRGLKFFYQCSNS